MDRRGLLIALCALVLVAAAAVGGYIWGDSKAPTAADAAAARAAKARRAAASAEDDAATRAARRGVTAGERAGRAAGRREGRRRATTKAEGAIAAQQEEQRRQEEQQAQLPSPDNPEREAQLRALEAGVGPNDPRVTPGSPQFDPSLYSECALGFRVEKGGNCVPE